MAFISSKVRAEFTKDTPLFNAKIFQQSPVQVILQDARDDNKRISDVFAQIATLRKAGISDADIMNYMDRMPKIQQTAFTLMLGSDRKFNGRPYREIIKNAFYRMWFDPMQSPRVRSIELNRLLNELNAYDASRIRDEEVFDITEEQITERVGAYLRGKAANAGADLDDEKLNEEAKRLAEAINSMLISAKMQSMDWVYDASVGDNSINGLLERMKNSAVRSDFVRITFGEFTEVEIQKDPVLKRIYSILEAKEKQRPVKTK